MTNAPQAFFRLRGEELGERDDANPTTALGAGSIAIQK